MNEQLVINGKEYVSVPVAAELVGYSTTYVEQLARGKWIDASSIQGSFFVSVDSLVRFVSLSEQQKAADNELTELESLWQNSVPSDASPDQWVVMSKAGIVALSGVFIGVLATVGVQAELTVSDLAYGSTAAWSLLVDTLSTSVAQLANVLVSTWSW